MMNDVKTHILNYAGVYFIIVMMVAGMVGYGFSLSHSSKPPKGFAGYSLGAIDKCYNENNNTLECYHLCRVHEWKEWHCLEQFEKTKTSTEGDKR